MGKKGKGKSGDLGRALLRDRFGSARTKRSSSESCMLHTADIDDGYRWDRLDLKSVTEESSFQEFLSTAQLAGTEFHAEKLNIKFVNPKSGIGLLSDKEKEELLETHRLNKDVLKIPRRPKWDESTSAQELQAKEKEEFLEWRRTLAMVQEAQALTMTPYEKNLEFWRQLWRVVERSDIVVQIVDARNPLLFRCEDLEKYAKEVDPRKMNMILLNKADFLTDEQRRIWANYFTERGVRIVFFSAKLSAEDTLREQRSNDRVQNDDEARNSDDEASDGEASNSDDTEVASSESEDRYTDVAAGTTSESEYESANDEADETENCRSAEAEAAQGDATSSQRRENVDTKEPEVESAETKNTETTRCAERDNSEIKNSSELLSRDKLISIFKSVYTGTTYTRGVTTVGLVGYPNVGKSSTINALLMDKKVSVSATPGKTKHFQTLYVDEELLLCDCPGLVMPSFVCTKAEMILNGILPIDQMRDHVPAVTLVGTLIPRHTIEDTYGIMLPLPLEGEDPGRPPTAEEMLNTYGYNRGFMTQNGQPDNPRSARYILKDFVNGKLLYCVAPPDQSQSEFHRFAARQKIVHSERIQPPRALRASRGVRITGQDVDKLFFQDRTTGSSHVRGGNPRSYCPTNGSIVASTQSLDLGDKPWKKINKHVNKRKREKSRRLYAHLDQH